MLGMTGAIKKQYPDFPIAASALTWLRQFAPPVAAGGCLENWFDLAGFGRQAIRNPSFVANVLKGTIDSFTSWCTTCNACMAAIKKGEPVRCIYPDPGRGEKK
jgi:2,4-dienoyl-CoA reductase-like NADH-dependent reductase (Old Yellow Enzyme family)